MVKEKTDEKQKKQPEATRRQKGGVECRCNSCGATLKVHPQVLYAPRAKPQLGTPEQKIPELIAEDGVTILRRARVVPAKSYQPCYKIQHKDVAGGICCGTLAMVRQRSTKKSRKG